MTKPVLIIHGGARGGWPTKAMTPVFRETMSAIVTEGYEILLSGGSAVEAATEGTKLLEDHPIFNAGRGSKI